MDNPNDSFLVVDTSSGDRSGGQRAVVAGAAFTAGAPSVAGSLVYGRLDGEWGGVSRNTERLTDSTTWTHTMLEFVVMGVTVEGQQHGVITGQGFSLWRDLEIGFEISGTFLGNKVLLTKQHRGRYRNSVQYEGVISRDTNTGMFVIRGSYSHGEFELQQICPEDSEITDAIQAVSRTTSPRDSLRPQSAETPAISPAPQQSGLASSFASDTALTLPATDGRGQGARNAKAAAPDSMDAHEAIQLLSGLWEGRSTDAEDHQTLWKETFLHCSQPAARSSSVICNLDGKGHSHWRGMDIAFDVIGTFNPENGSIKLIKQHKGRFTNSVSYNCRLSKQSTASKGDKTTVQIRLSGEYANGRLELTKLQQTRVGILGSLASLRLAKWEPPERNALLHEYGFFLAGILTERQLTAREQETITKFQQRFNISPEDHVAVLKALNITSAEYEMCEASKDNGPEGGSDICTICCDKQINCIMVPCGHFAICLDCAAKLRGKPCIMCRRHVDKFQPVYRT